MNEIFIYSIYVVFCLIIALLFILFKLKRNEELKIDITYFPFYLVCILFLELFIKKFI